MGTKGGLSLLDPEEKGRTVWSEGRVGRWGQRLDLGHTMRFSRLEQTVSWGISGDMRCAAMKQTQRNFKSRELQVENEIPGVKGEGRKMGSKKKSPTVGRSCRHRVRAQPKEDGDGFDRE